MIDCQPLDKTMSTIPLPLWTSKVNFTPPPPFPDSANFVRGGCVDLFWNDPMFNFLEGRGVSGDILP